MNLKVFAGSLLALGYNQMIGQMPVRNLRKLYLRGWLGKFGTGTGVQTGCRFLNGRKVHLGDPFPESGLHRGRRSRRR